MILKRNSIYWYKFKWSIKAADGTREHFVIYKTARTSNKREAQAAQEEHKRALRLGLIHPKDPWPKPPAQTPPTLREFAKKFLAFSATHTKPGTARFYGECVKRFLAFASIAERPLPDVNGELISKYARWRRSDTCGNAIVTVNGDLRTLRRILRLAYEWGILDRVPIVHELPGDKGRDRVISHAEELSYLEVASATLHDMTVLAVDTGLRPNSELFTLEWSRVHLDASKDAPNGFLHVNDGKTAGAVRNVPLTRRGQEVLKKRRQANRFAKFVFPGDGNKGHIVTVQHAHERACTKSKIGAFPYYCWRHTFGTRCAQSGMDRFSLARLMGHSSPRVAERYYIHVTESHVASGFERFAAYQETMAAKASKKAAGA